MGRAFSEFCVQEGVDPERFKTVIAEAYGTDGSHGMIGQLERGEIEIDVFETWLAEHLSEGLEKPLLGQGIRDRMFAGMGPDEAMIEAVRSAHEAGVKTALISN